MPELVALIDVVIKEQATEIARRPAPMTFQSALEALYASRFTGRVYLDFGEGRPAMLTLPNPLHVRLER